ncbi:YihY/virulence factor BrkB family protein [Luteolibacter pohnpeiensis]|uniref:YihY/virulence factor BrkB family protein n=1 Tax=Luteolibacter pohnpeiensis TaxID=454153 RepID=A0A934VUK8_9BACT|nr:YihY/virulence factor BrkB family protein [Luteolibacter pohnpeiensis]MBK1881240.1 YihY/virulence factor BrkB family protein [Luteolibacter pohnpeiensis]
MTPFQLLKSAASEWMSDKSMRLSAALAYYSVFSLAPLLIVAISIAGAIFGEDAARGAVRDQLTGAIGDDAATAVQEMISGAHKSGNNAIMAVVGVLVLLVSASGVFAQLKDAMNTVWQIEVKPGRGILAIAKDRILSLTMVLVIGFLLLISLLLSAAVAATTDYLAAILPIPGFLWLLVSFLISISVITLLFAMIFKILPDATVKWEDVWIGAFLTACLFSIGKLLLALYLGRQEAASTYGAAGALILILSWVYYSSNILLFGAEFTQVYARSKGRRIEPKPGAVRVGSA